MKVLVTGGNGFLGSSVVAELAASGHDVISADLTAGAERHRGSRVQTVILDVTDGELVDWVVGEHRPDCVVHLASIVTPGKDSSRDLQYAVDVDGSRHVFEACVHHDVRRVVVSSSGAAYGYHPDNPTPLTEDDPIRGNEEFAYSDHKRQVEEMLAGLRQNEPQLEQVVLRIGTILGERVDNQITALFDRTRLLKIRGADSPFVFIWDTDVVAIIQQAVTGRAKGVFNVAGDGALTIDEIARVLHKQTLTVPEPLLRGLLWVGSRLGVTAYGPEQTKFLQYRPVLANDRLKKVFGFTPTHTSREAFDAWRTSALARQR